MFVNVSPPPQVYVPVARPAEVRTAPIRQELRSWQVQQDQFQGQGEVTYATPNYQEVLRTIKEQVSADAAQPVDATLMAAKSLGATDVLLTLGLTLAIMSYMSRAVS